MSYSIHFFALDAASVAQLFESTRKTLLSRVEERLQGENRFDDEEIQSTVTKAAAICGGDIPSDCDEGYFDALCWLTEVVGEKIIIGSFLGFRHLQFLGAVGIWPRLLRSRPCFVVPATREAPPQVGFLGSDDIVALAPSILDELPATDSVEVSYATTGVPGSTGVTCGRQTGPAGGTYVSLRASSRLTKSADGMDLWQFGLSADLGRGSWPNASGEMAPPGYFHRLAVGWMQCLRPARPRADDSAICSGHRQPRSDGQFGRGRIPVQLSSGRQTHGSDGKDLVR